MTLIGKINYSLSIIIHSNVLLIVFISNKKSAKPLTSNDYYNLLLDISTDIKKALSEFSNNAFVLY